MAIKMVREPSETPNINNIDDIIPMRYAYGGQNGYVIGKGNEISNTVNGLNFTVNSGRLVLQGVECDIDATGVTITIDNIATKRYYTVYLEVNLGLNTATIKSEYDTATYPTIDAGDDLTANSTGIARMVLYKFTATSGVIGEVNKVVDNIGYPLSDYDTSKGTIEERLTNLGFKQGAFIPNNNYKGTSSGINYELQSISGQLTRQGNYVIGNVEWVIKLINPAPLSLIDFQSGVIGYVPNNFIPENDINIPIILFYYEYDSSSTFPTEKTYRTNITIKSNGEIYIPSSWHSYSPITLGYEAKPLE